MLKVVLETLGKKMYVPMLISTAMPMVIIKAAGSIQALHMISSVVMTSTTARQRIHRGSPDSLAELMVPPSTTLRPSGTSGPSTKASFTAFQSTVASSEYWS